MNKTIILTVMLTMMIFGNTKQPSQTAHATGIPVFDAAEAASSALEYVEWLFQHFQMLKDTAIELEELEQLYREWEWALERYRSLTERFGDDFLDLLVEDHEKKWGDTEFTDLITTIDPRDAGFIDAMTAVIEQYIGGRAYEPGEIEGLIASWNIDDADAQEALRRHFTEHSNRQVLLQESIIAGAAVEARILEYHENIKTQAEQIKGLEGNSDTASLQMIAQTNVMGAEHQLEMMGILAKILANQNQSAMINNIDQMKEKEAAVESQSRAVSRPLQ